MSAKKRVDRPPAFSRRLIFSYDRSDVRLDSQQRVEMKAPVSDPVQEAEGETGFWYELHDAEGRTLYRRVTQNPIQFAAEVRSEDPDRRLRWETVTDPTGTFVLLLPDLEQATTLVLFSSPLDPAAPPGPARELTRFDLAEG